MHGSVRMWLEIDVAARAREPLGKPAPDCPDVPAKPAPRPRGPATHPACEGRVAGSRVHLLAELSVQARHQVHVHLWVASDIGMVATRNVATCALPQPLTPLRVGLVVHDASALST